LHDRFSLAREERDTDAAHVRPFPAPCDAPGGERMIALLGDPQRGREPRTSHSLVVSALGREIVAGRFPPGATLPGDKELGERFHVSRTVLREAMKTLAAKSLVEAKTRVGTKVLDPARWDVLDRDVLRWRMEAGLDERFIDDIATMRLAFEPACALLTARRASQADVARLYALADRLGDTSLDRAAIARADLDFHLAIIEMSRNPFMRGIGNLIEAALAITFALSSPADDPAMIREGALNHRRIVDAMVSGDEAAIRAAVSDVITLGAQRTAAQLARG
jgi:DNA-binding FadR family transcriptional regulator